MKTMTWARLAFRLQRSSIGAAALVSLGLAALGAWLALSLPSMLANCDVPRPVDQCGTVYLFDSPMGDPALLFYLGIGVAMYAVPVVLGAPMLPSEVQRRTAMIAWPLARSHLKWLAWRARCWSSGSCSSGSWPLPPRRWRTLTILGRTSAFRHTEREASPWF
jgi:hypothetical protein